ncbi:MAG: cysteine desulfurase family protein [Calditrichia bacterium]
MNSIIYLDYNATTPIAPEVREEILPFLEGSFGNPSCSHVYGLKAREGVDLARRRVAELLGVSPLEVVFTSGGSESNNFAIKGLAWRQPAGKNHIITSQIEHPAVLEVCRFLKKNGFRVTYLPVDRFGRVNPEDVKKAITTATLLVTIMHANNEVGTIQPIPEIAEITRQHGVLLHSDAAQSVGKIPVTIASLGVDLLTIAGHKLYAPKGIGALFIRDGVVLENLIHGAAHELGRRAGTENVALAAGLGKACQIAADSLSATTSKLRQLRDRLQEGLLSNLPKAVVNGHPEFRLPNTLSISFPGIEANQIIENLPDLAISAGAACHSDRVQVSHVLKAMGVPEKVAMGTLRLSLGKMTMESEIEQAIHLITGAVRKLA